MPKTENAKAATANEADLLALQNQMNAAADRAVSSFQALTRQYATDCTSIGEEFRERMQADPAAYAEVYANCMALFEIKFNAAVDGLIPKG